MIRWCVVNCLSGICWTSKFLPSFRSELFSGNSLVKIFFCILQFLSAAYARMIQQENATKKPFKLEGGRWLTGKYYPGQKKIVTAKKFLRSIYSSIMWYRTISSFGSTSKRPAVSARCELALQIKVDVAWYHMIALRIRLMSILAVTIFLARVVYVWSIFSVEGLQKK